MVRLLIVHTFFFCLSKSKEGGGKEEQDKGGGSENRRALECLSITVLPLVEVYKNQLFTSQKLAGRDFGRRAAASSLRWRRGGRGRIGTWKRRERKKKVRAVLDGDSAPGELELKG